jgi:hypothetical protein
MQSQNIQTIKYAVTTGRMTLLKLLPEIDARRAEQLLRNLHKMSERVQVKNGSSTTILMTQSLNVTGNDIDELFVGDDKSRVTVSGVNIIMSLYSDGFFTGSLMKEPTIVKRIASHLLSQQAAAA